MNRASPTTTARAGRRFLLSPRSSEGSSRRRSQFALAACLAIIAGCTTIGIGVGTSVEEVWRDSAWPEGAPLGKTLVLTLASQEVVVTTLENEWVRQLRDRGIDAHAATPLLPGERPPSKERVVALVGAQGFDTLLVSRVVDVKAVERDVSASQVAVLETNLYQTKTEKRFWSARADTFVINPTGERVIEARGQRARDFVETMIREMSDSKVL